MSADCFKLRTSMRKFLQFCGLFFLTIPCFGQGTQHDGINSRGTVKAQVFANNATLAMAGTTPSVAGGNTFRTTNGGVTTITNFLNGVDSQEIVVICGDTNTTIQNNANIAITGGVNFSCSANAAISFIFSTTSNVWSQVGGSGGGGGGGSPGAPAKSLQCNSGSGTFIACNAIDDGTNLLVNDNLQIFGPNPYNDVMAYGGCVSTAQTTASCNGTTAITLASALDFKDAGSFPKSGIGNGIVIYQCGAATGLTVPSAPTVTPIGLSGGGTTYTYKLAPEDLSGGMTAASAQGQTTTGASALGATTVNLTVASWTNTNNGQNTYTCSANCNIQNGTQIRIDGFTNTNFDGNYTILSNNGTNQFTVPSPRTPTVTTESVAATVKLLACNVLTLPASSVAAIETGGDTVLRYWVYRNGVLATVIQGHDPYYEDCGMNITAAPLYVPGTPGSAVNKYLATTIVSGGGTVNIVVANAAGNTIGGQPAAHDNSQNLLATAVVSHFGTPVYVAPGLTFNATTIFNNIKAANTNILLPGGAAINQPWVVKTNGIKFTGGQSNGTTSFQFDNLVNIGCGGFGTGPGNSCYAFPLVYVVPLTLNTTGSGDQFENIFFNGTQLGQSGLMVQFDQNTLFGLQMRHIGFASNGSASNVNTPAAWIAGITESIVGQVGDRNTCTTAQNNLGPPCLRFTAVSRATSSGNTSIAGIVDINGFTIQGGSPSYQVDALPYIYSGGSLNGIFGITSMTFNKGLREIGKGAYLRKTSASGGNFYFRSLDDDAPNADPGNGWVDNTGGFTGDYFDAEQLGGSVTGQVLVSGAGNVRCGPVVLHTCVSSSTIGFGSAAGASANGNISANGAITVGYALGTPNAPTVVLGGGGSCVSNCVPAGTYFYAITANDIYGNGSPLSACSASVTTDGTKTITVGWTLIAGQLVTRRFRGTTCSGAISTDGVGTGVEGNSYVDLGSTSYSNSTLPSGGALASLGSSGVYGTQLGLVGGGFQSVISGTFTVNRTPILEDASGFIPVTTETFVSSPRGEQNIFFPGALTTTWTGATWTIDKAITVTRVQVQTKTAPSGCGTNGIIRVTDGTTPINSTISAAAIDSGAISQNYAAGAVLTAAIQTAAATCTVSPGDSVVTIQYRMQ